MKITILNKRIDQIDLKKYPQLKLMLLYSQQKESELNKHLTYIKTLPVLGCCVSSTKTNKRSAQQNDTSIVILEGGFDVHTFSQEIDYTNPTRTAEEISEKIKNKSLCLMHSSNLYEKSIVIDFILREIQCKNPNTQIWGMAASPKPWTITNDGIEKDHIAFAVITGIDFDFYQDSGFEFNTKRTETYTITSSDEYGISKIDNSDAIERYSRIMHMRPYMINSTYKLTSNPNVAKAYKKLSQINPVLNGVITNNFIKPMGMPFKNQTAELLLTLHMDEKKTRKILPQSYKRPGTQLRHLKTTPMKQLAVYNRLFKKHPNAKGILISSCALRPMWFNFNMTALEEKIEKFNGPFLIAHIFGEYGTDLPYKNNENLVHSGVIKALVFN